MLNNLPPLPNSDLNDQLISLMKRHPDLTVADVEYDPYKREYRIVYERKDE